MKKMISLWVALILILSTTVIEKNVAYASTYTCLSFSNYSGTYDGSTPMEFTISSVNKENSTFTGHIKFGVII